MSAPLSPLEITAGHIRVLADQQSQAARAVFDARLKAVDVNTRVEKTHGTVCDDTAKALKRAEEERIRATRMVQAQSEDLAVKLEHAAETYDTIDAQEKRAIDQQMRPGG
ncbi:type VII secretion target [Mycobacterium adipatum]|uniref:type VII secretion target n=1 Tax=Mycobacterium adipatum TaxID=1682113 RepID=UPI0034E09CFB